jgi:hypothetical protein
MQPRISTGFPEERRGAKTGIEKGTKKGTSLNMEDLYKKGDITQYGRPLGDLGRLGLKPVLSRLVVLEDEDYTRDSEPSPSQASTLTFRTDDPGAPIGECSPRRCRPFRH